MRYFLFPPYVKDRYGIEQKELDTIGIKKLLMPCRKTLEAKDKANKELDKEVKGRYEARGREDT